MDSGIGIGGLSTGKDELASSQFDLFDNIELETGVKKMHTQTFLDLFHQHLVGDPSHLKFQQILKNLLMQNLFVYMVVCELEKILLMY